MIKIKKRYKKIIYFILLIIILSIVGSLFKNIIRTNIKYNFFSKKNNNSLSNLNNKISSDNINYKQLIYNLSNEGRIINYYINFNKKNYIEWKSLYKLNFKLNESKFAKEIKYSNSTFFKELNNIEIITRIILKHQYDYGIFLNKYNLQVPKFNTIYKIQRKYKYNQINKLLNIKESVYKINSNVNNLSKILYSLEENTIGANSIYNLSTSSIKTCIKTSIINNEKIMYYSKFTNNINIISYADGRNISIYNSKNYQNDYKKNSFINKNVKLKQDNELLNLYSKKNWNTKLNRHRKKPKINIKSNNFKIIIGSVTSLLGLLTVGFGTYCIIRIIIKYGMSREKMLNFAEILENDFFINGNNNLVAIKSKLTHDFNIHFENIKDKKLDIHKIVQDLKTRHDIYRELLTNPECRCYLDRVSMENKNRLYDEGLSIFPYKYKYRTFKHDPFSIYDWNKKKFILLNLITTGKLNEIKWKENTESIDESSVTLPNATKFNYGAINFEQPTSLITANQEYWKLEICDYITTQNINEFLDFLLNSTGKYYNSDDKDVLAFVMMKKIYQQIRIYRLWNENIREPKIPLNKNTWKIFFFQNDSLYNEYSIYMNHIFELSRRYILINKFKARTKVSKVLLDEESYLLVHYIFNGQIHQIATFPKIHNSLHLLFDCRNLKSHSVVIPNDIFNIIFFSPNREQAITELINYMRQHALNTQNLIKKLFYDYSSWCGIDEQGPIFFSRVTKINKMEQLYHKLYTQMLNISHEGRIWYENSDIKKPECFDHLDMYLGNDFLHPDFVYNSSIMHIMNDLVNKAH